jgi:hypothetical protein
MQVARFNARRRVKAKLRPLSEEEMKKRKEKLDPFRGAKIEIDGLIGHVLSVNYLSQTLAVARTNGKVIHIKPVLATIIEPGR